MSRPPLGSDWLHAGASVVGATGAAVSRSNLVSARIGVGVYTLALDQAVGPSEVVCIVTAAGAALGADRVASLEHTSDSLKTIRITQAGVLVDQDFNVSMFRLNTQPPAVVADEAVGGAASNSLIYRPGGGQTGPVIFDDWTALFAQLQALRAGSNGGGTYDIVMEDGFAVGPIIFPVGSYDMTGVTWAGNAGPLSLFGSQSHVRIDEGVVFPNLVSFRGVLRFENAATATSPIPLPSTYGVRVVLAGSVFFTSGNVPTFAGFGVGFFAAFEMDFATISSPGVTVDIPVGATVAFIPGTGSNISAGTISGGGVLLALPADSGGEINGSQPGFGGTFLHIDLLVDYIDTPAIAVAPKAASGLNLPTAIHRYDVSGGAIAQPLPLALNWGKRPMYFQEVSGNVGLTLVPAGLDTINGIAAPFAVPAGGAVLVVQDGITDAIVITLEP